MPGVLCVVLCAMIRISQFHVDHRESYACLMRGLMRSYAWRQQPGAQNRVPKQEIAFWAPHLMRL